MIFNEHVILTNYGKKIRKKLAMRIGRAIKAFAYKTNEITYKKIKSTGNQEKRKKATKIKRTRRDIIEENLSKEDMPSLMKDCWILQALEAPYIQCPTHTIFLKNVLK